MRNVVSSLKRYFRGVEVSSHWHAVAVLAMLLVSTPAQPWPGARAATTPGLLVSGTPAPSLARIFTPRQAPEGAYAVTALTEGIDDALRLVKEALAPNAKAGEPAGSWQVQQLDPLEAFGTAGTYDRSKVARLYTGHRVSVVRGPVEQARRVVAAVTLVSPYPDAALSRLEKGTMVIVLRIGGS
jgi:hypothetical protein